MDGENNMKGVDDTYCPGCGKIIKKDFTACPYCKKDLGNKKPDGWDRANKVGKGMQDIGCILTIFITIPVVLIIIFLVMCGRS